MSSEKEVVIIGAGFSGLAAALYLKRHGVEPTLLEARDRVGGRVCTEVVGGVSVDMGGAYVGACQNRLLRMAHDLGVETYCVYDEGRGVVELCGQRKEFTGSVPPMSLWSQLWLNELRQRMQSIMNGVDLLRPWDSVDAEKWDRITVQEWVDGLGVSKEAEEVMRLAVVTVCAVEPYQLSMLSLAWYMKSADGLERATEVSNGLQERKFTKGSHFVCQRMAEEIGDSCICFEHVVRGIRWQEDDGSCVMDVQYGKEHYSIVARHVIVALSPTLYSRLNFMPALPTAKRTISQRMFMGSACKVTVYYDRPYWKEKGMRGQQLCDRGPIAYTMDDSKPEKGEYALLGFMLGRDLEKWWEKPPQERHEAVIELLVRQFDCADMRQYTRIVEKDWREESYSGGGYTGIVGCGVLSSVGHGLRTPVGCVHFAGTELAKHFSGYMDGAIESGERAAHEVLQARGVVDQEFCFEEPEHDSVSTLPPSPAGEWWAPFPSTLQRVAGYMSMGASVGVAVAVAARWVAVV